MGDFWQDAYLAWLTGKPINRPWLNLPVSELPASVRVRNSLYRAGVHTLADFQKVSWSEIVAVKQLGCIGQAEVNDICIALGVEPQARLGSDYALAYLGRMLWAG